MTAPQSVEVLKTVLRSADARRALGGWMLGNAGEWAWVVALLVYAHMVGGLALVGITGLARTLPAAILAPAITSLADGLPRHRVLFGIHAGRAILLGLAAVLAGLDGPPVLIFGIASVDALLAVIHRPTHMSLMPAISRSPAELVGSNAASSTVEALGLLVGPVIGAALISTGSASLSFAVPAAAFALAAWFVMGLRPSRSSSRLPGGRPSALHGLRALRERPHAALLLGLFAMQTTVRGILSVLIVAGATGMLAMGAEGVGFLNGAIGAGGLIGALLATTLVGHGRMAPLILVGLALWGLPILATGALPFAGVALVALGVVGAGNALLDVSGFTLLQRSVPNAARGSVFGVLEALVMLTVGIGSLIGPWLVITLGVQGAWIATGAVLPVLALLSARSVLAADGHAVIPARELALLRGVPMLRVLPLTALEQAAGEFEPMRFAAGSAIIRQGEIGDRFYVIAEGTVEARAGERVLRRQAAGDSFGEIALLRDVPRTADVIALTDVELYAIGRDDFLHAVTGDHQSTAAADAVIRDRYAAG